MTAEELRQATLKGIDGILDAPWIVQRLLSNQDRRLLRAQRRFWQQDKGIQLAWLLALLEQEPLTEYTPPEGETTEDSAPR